MKPSVTFITFIQLPLLGAFFIICGKRANRVKGKARAMAKPSMPIVGATMLPLVLTSTSRKPMMGPVQLKLTSASVNAMRKMLSKPVELCALPSTALLHELGSVISKPPRKLAPNTTRRRKKKMLKTALVARELRALAPKSSVTSKPSET